MKFLISILFLIQSQLVFSLTNSTTEADVFFDSIILIKSEAIDESGTSAPGYCNATLLSPTIAITAAHCIKLAYLTNNYTITIKTGNYKYTKLANGEIKNLGFFQNNSIDVNFKILISEKLKKQFDEKKFKTNIKPNEDVALIYWEDEIISRENKKFPSLVTPNELNQLTKTLNNYSLQVVSINPFTEMSNNIRRSAILNQVDWTFSKYIKSNSLSRVEEGDSGSPLFIKIGNENKILAVVKGKAETIFNEWDAFSVTAKFICEVKDKLPIEKNIFDCL